ncbi:hypothetical protein C8Q77DRAFT_1132986, partial [Trametes polyzona]
THVVSCRPSWEVRALSVFPFVFLRTISYVMFTSLLTAHLLTPSLLRRAASRLGRRPLWAREYNASGSPAPRAPRDRAPTSRLVRNPAALYRMPVVFTIATLALSSFCAFFIRKLRVTLQSHRLTSRPGSAPPLRLAHLRDLAFRSSSSSLSLPASLAPLFPTSLWSHPIYFAPHIFYLGGYGHLLLISPSSPAPADGLALVFCH